MNSLQTCFDFAVEDALLAYNPLGKFASQGSRDHDLERISCALHSGEKSFLHGRLKSESV